MMKVMNKLTTLTLTAAIVPALTFGGAVFASEHDDTGMQNDEHRTGEQQLDDQDLDQQQNDDQGFDQQQNDGQDSDALGMDDQRDDEAFMSNKPTGGLYADDLIGKNVQHRQSGDNVGEIKDLIIGEDGRIAGVVVTTGTFLGLGGQEVSMGWDQLEHSMEDDESVFYTDMDEDSLKNAPEFNRD